MAGVHGRRRRLDSEPRCTATSMRMVSAGTPRLGVPVPTSVLKVSYLIDSGAEVSVLPLHPEDR